MTTYKQFAYYFGSDISEESLKRIVHSFFLGNFFSGLFMLVLLTGWSPDTAADDTVAGKTGSQGLVTPVSQVVFINTAADAESISRSYKLYEELVLLLDGYEIVFVTSGVSGFVSRPLHEKLRVIRRLDAASTAGIFVWIEISDAKTVTLYFVLTGTKRATVRTVEADLSDDSEVELALSVRELLATVSDERLQTANMSASAEASDEHLPIEVDVAQTLWSVLFLLGAQNGVYGHQGSSLQLGGGPAVAYWFGDFYLRLSFVADFGPFERQTETDIFAWSLAPALAFGYQGKFRQAVFGPLVELTVPWTKMEMTIDAGNTHTENWWQFKAGLGGYVGLMLNPKFAITLEGQAKFAATRKNFAKASDGNLVLSTPILSWDARIGGAFLF